MSFFFSFLCLSPFNFRHREVRQQQQQTLKKDEKQQRKRNEVELTIIQDQTSIASTTEHVERILFEAKERKKKRAVTRDRTRDLQIFSLTLSQLSYPGEN